MEAFESTNYKILSLYGVNGLTEEHIQAIKELKELNEIIFFFDGDKPGREATRNILKSSTKSSQKSPSARYKPLKTKISTH
ncbi:toprim domain-containing protein [Flavobacterium columnare]|uniref:toprim domain-containing protein n=1 Tax=Flavobacterium columnare TaxID=996 RepID=UPI0039952718|nr:toprim domain-containing protein [Flavobacterium columnare]